jgi:hypothetical protein
VNEDRAEREERAERFLAILAAGSGEGTVSLLTLCLGATSLLPVTGAAIVLMSQGSTHSVASALAGQSQALQDLEFTLGEGPGVDSLHQGSPVITHDLSSADLRWPQFAPAAHVLGARMIYALPLQAEDATVGVLTLYRDETGSLSAAEHADALLVARLVTQLVLTMQAGAISESLAWSLDLSDDRAVVHQATGMIAVQLDCGVDEALVRLRAFAFAAERPIHDIAADVVEGHLRLDRA